VHSIHIDADSYTLHTGLIALALHPIVAVIVQALFGKGEAQTPALKHQD
jgi:SSS family solute:Na+ symporter